MKDNKGKSDVKNKKEKDKESKGKSSDQVRQQYTFWLTKYCIKYQHRNYKELMMLYLLIKISAYFLCYINISFY